MVYFEVFVEICFGIDIVLTFFSAYFDDENNVTITDLKLIAIHYLKLFFLLSIEAILYRTWFLIDVLAIFPFRFITSDKLIIKKKLIFYLGDHYLN